MVPTELDTTTGWTLLLRDQAATEALATTLAPMLKKNDVVSLSGDLGAGKTTFARALIRLLQNDPDLEVPSPTFTLLQSYDAGPLPILHADLYRIRDEDELAELGWDESADQSLLLIEWPERMGARLPADRLDIAFRLVAEEGEDARRVVLSGHGTFAARLRNAKAIAGLLATAGFADARLRTADPAGRHDRHPDDLAAPRRCPGRTVRQTLPSRGPARGRHPAVPRHGRGPGRPRHDGAGHQGRGSSGRPRHPRGFRGRARGAGRRADG